MAAENEADFVIFEQSGLLDKPSIRTAFDTAWAAVDRMRNGNVGEFDDPEHARRAQLLTQLPVHPELKAATAKKGKLLRAEPVAQQWWDDRMRTGTYLPELESEWQTWQVTDPMSPGRIDASVYLAYVMGIVPGAEAMVNIVSGLTRQQVQMESQRRQNTASVAQPQMGARIQRTPLRPGP